MKENDAFKFIGDMPSFNELLGDVSSLTPEDWLKYVQRKKIGGAAGGNTDTIPLVYDVMQKLNSDVVHEHYRQFSKYLDEVVLATMETIGEVKIQQSILARLRAKTTIPKHKDVGNPLTAKIHSQTHRIHVPVITNENCIFTIGDESKNLKPGQIWIVDNVGRHHGVKNSGDEDRVHLIIDAI
jgi:hypothetical protein